MRTTQQRPRTREEVEPSARSPARQGGDDDDLARTPTSAFGDQLITVAPSAKRSTRRRDRSVATIIALLRQGHGDRPGRRSPATAPQRVEHQTMKPRSNRETANRVGACRPSCSSTSHPAESAERPPGEAASQGERPTATTHRPDRWANEDANGGEPPEGDWPRDVLSMGVLATRLHRQAGRSKPSVVERRRWLQDNHMSGGARGRRRGLHRLGGASAVGGPADGGRCSGGKFVVRTPSLISSASPHHLDHAGAGLEQSNRPRPPMVW